MSERHQNHFLRTAILIAGLTAVALVAVFGVLKYQDWQATLDSPEMEQGLGPGSPPSPESFNPGREVSEKAAITSVKIVSATKAGTYVEDDELVIGVVIDGKARAYSLNMMTMPEREVFNDSLAGQPIAATW